MGTSRCSTSGRCRGPAVQEEPWLCEAVMSKLMQLFNLGLEREESHLPPWGRVAAHSWFTLAVAGI